jgi:hypothetical protein
MARIQNRLLHVTAVNVLVTLVVDTRAAQEIGKPDLGVNLPPALLLALSSTDGAEKNIHLLERQTLGLREVEENESGAERGERTEEDVGAVFHVCEHVGCDLTNDKVIHPIIFVSLGLQGEGDGNKAYQLDEAPSAIPYGRLEMGQISATTIQAQGPQEYPK